jgi:hypothetical protein
LYHSRVVPLAGRQEAFGLAVDADVGLLGKAEGLGVAVDPFETDHFGKLPEIDIAGLDDRVVEINPLMPLVAAELLPADLERPHALDALHRIDHRVLEGGQSGDDLESRARKVSFVHRLVDQWPKRVAGELGVALGAQPAAHLVGVVDRLRIECANGAGMNIDDDRRPGRMGSKRAVERLHESHVDSQLNVVTGNRRPEHLDFE